MWHAHSARGWLSFILAHFCTAVVCGCIAWLQEKPLDFYEQFHVIVLGLDSLEARRYMNSVACSFLGRWGAGQRGGVAGQATRRACSDKALLMAAQLPRWVGNVVAAWVSFLGSACSVLGGETLLLGGWVLRKRYCWGASR